MECADFLGIKGKTNQEKFDNLLAAIDELKAKVGIKKTIKEYGVDEKYFLDTLDEMVEQAFDDQCTGANPRYPLMKRNQGDVSAGLLRQIIFFPHKRNRREAPDASRLFR